MAVGDVALDGIEAFSAQGVFHAAGILSSCPGVHTQVNQPVGQQCMAFIHGVRYGLSGWRQRDMSLVVHLDISVLAEILHSHADTGFGEAQLSGNVDGADIGLFLGQHEYGFQIIFC